MKKMKIYLTLIILVSFSYSLPHFIFDGIESSHECLKGKDQISFTIYGTLNEKSNLRKISIDDYYIEDIGYFKCLFSENENSKNEKRKHKIICSINGSFPRNGYILDEPKVQGFDFLNGKGESSWPKKPEKKTFLIGKCGEKIELDDEPKLFATTATTYSNPLNKVNKSNVNKALSGLPGRTTVTEENMCTAMKKAQEKYSLNQAESAYLVYKWLLENIQYDCYGFYHGTIDYDEHNTYNKGKGVCHAYSLIFGTMCKALGLEAVYISGYSKGASYTIGKMPTKTDHAWNAVKIDSNYYLIDSTWGAGSCNGDTFTKKSKDFYFCTNPEYFIRSHLPADNQWQLLSKTINLQQFVDMLKLDDSFYENGFKTISPDSPTINVSGKSKVTLTYDKSIKLSLLNHLYFLEGNTYKEQSNTCFYTKSNGKAEITFAINNKGEYKLKIFGGPSGSESYPQIIEYKITSSKKPNTTVNFPTLYGLYSSSETQIVAPLNNPLKKGSSINFKVKSTLKNLYVIVGDKLYRELDNQGGGLFSGESVYIFGNKVRLSTKNGNSYSALADYTTIKDPSKKEEPTFPQGYSAPKNILYSPLTDTLKKGTSYTFKIKCESVNDIVIIDAKNYFHLKKSGATFSGTLKIDGSGGKVQIAQYNSNKYSIFYSYKVS